jgi:hypothetical protein
MFARYLVGATAVAAMMMCFCGSATARDQVTYLYGSDLAKYCAAPGQTTDYMVCDRFVAGALEVVVNNPSYGLSPAHRT